MHSLKLRRSGIACAILHRAAPMGLKKVLSGLGYYKHVAPTELPATAPTKTLSDAAPRAADRTGDATGAFAGAKVDGVLLFVTL